MSAGEVSGPHGALFAGEAYYYRFGLIDRTTGKVFTEDLEIHLFELTKFSKGAEELETTLDQWLYFVNHGEALDEVRLPRSMGDRAIRQALEELMVLSQRDLEREIYEGREKQRRDENARLRHAQQQGLQAGRAQGLQEGRQQGLEQGLHEGLLQGEMVGQILLIQSCSGVKSHLARPLSP